MSPRQCVGTVFAACTFASGGAVFADIYFVPDDYPTIQAAIDGVGNGDEIGVRPGTYAEAIDFHAKAIRLYSTDGPDVTTIDGTGLGASVVTCDEGEGPETILDGFTITGGTGTYLEDLEITLGGGMVIVGSSPTVRDCAFIQNVTEAGGGLAILLEANPTIETCRFESNEVTRSTSQPDIGGGGGILVYDAAATVTGCAILSNQAFDAGGMMAMRSDTTITGSRFEYNTVSDAGAGLYNIEGEMDVRDSVFRSNTAAGHAGGFADNYGARVTISGCDFIGNSALSSGGALIWYTTEATITDCLFQENSTETYAGGGLGLGYTTTAIERCRFVDNTAPNAGGGIAIVDDGHLTVTSCEFTGNHGTYGGGLYSSLAETLVITASTFTDNVADVRGGGIYSEFCGNLRVTACLLAGNTALDGGAILTLNGTQSIVATTIMDNTATNSAGGVYNCCSSNLTICGSVLWGNTGDQIANWTGATTTATYTDVQGGYVGIGNLDVDPLCVDPSGGDYRLLPTSECIDAGANNALPVDEFDLDDDGDTKERLPLDLDGNYRFADLDTKEDTGCGLPVIVDMGVYEYQGDPVHPVLIGDIDGNGLVGFTDILEVLADWGVCSDACCLADINYDSFVNVTELLAILANWS